MSESLNVVDGRPVLRIERRLAHPVEKVWRAVTEPAHLSQWYPYRIPALDLRVGGTIAFDDEAGEVNDGVITELDPQRIFAFTVVDARSGSNQVHMELRPHDDGCLLIFTHSCDDLPGAASFAAGWTFCLDALRAVLADRRPAEAAGFVERHESYIREFGLDEGAAEATPEGWRVRFVRQLMMQPIDKVWADLAGDGGAGDPAVGGAVPGGFRAAGIPAGPVTAVRPGALLEYEWLSGDRAAGRVRWELTEGPGGARVTLTQDGPPDLADQRQAARAAWHEHIERLAGRLSRRT